MRSLYSWMGGKFYESSFIIELMPVHLWYTELFAGSLVLLLSKPKSMKEFANDKFSCLVSFWNTIKSKEKTVELQQRMKNALDSRYEYQRYMRMNPKELDMIDRAYRFLYLVTFGFNSFMETFYSPISHKIYKIKDHMSVFQNNADRMLEVHKRVKNVMFSNYDFGECLDKIKPHKDKFIFLDPPYIDTHQYNRGYGEDLNFPENYYGIMRDKLAVQHKGGTKWMITCNQINTYFDEMDDVVIKLIDRRACINKNKERVDVKTKVVMNYSVEDVGSCLEMLEDKEEEGEFCVP